MEAISETLGFTYEKFNEAVNQYRTLLFVRYESLDNEEQLKETLNDKLEALSSIYKSQINAKSIQDLGQYIDSLFSDETSPITLSTCHRAKGLEGKRIFLHRAEDMPMRWRSQLDWQFEQEMNLLYVALTRSQNELVIVGNPDWLNLDDELVEAEAETTVNIYSETSTMEAATIEITADVYADSTKCNIEYVAGQELYELNWAEFLVNGLDKWAVREGGSIPDSDSHSASHPFVCLDVPENQVFTIFEQDSDKQLATDRYKFFICKASREMTRIESSYSDKRFIAGNFESICQGIGKTKAPRLHDWWISYVGDQDGNNRTNEEKLAFANHCLNHINKRGIKALPAFEMPQSAIIDNPLELNTKPLTEAGFKQWVNINSITLDAGTQSRQQTNQVTIDDYQRQMEDEQWNWEFEPLPLLFTDGNNYYPGDGHHRILAAMTVREDIFAEVRQGTLRDAIFYSCQANRFHGLQRSRADKRNQVELLLCDLEWQIMSDRAIAEHCGVSAPFVGNIRHELVKSGTVNIFSQRTDKKGRTIETDNIGKRPGAAIESETKSEFLTTDLSIPVEIETDHEVVAPEASQISQIDSLCSEIGTKSLALLVIDRLSPYEKRQVCQLLSNIILDAFL